VNRLDAGSPWLDTGLVPAGCAACQEVHLVDADLVGGVCLACTRGLLEAMPARMTAKPESVVPFAHAPETLRTSLDAFIGQTPMRCPDLQTQNLLARVVAVWWPMWLVDADVVGHWSAEAGYNYEAKSSRETFSGGKWVTQEVIDTRVRWEDRVGTVDRHYDNVSVKSVEDHDRLVGLLGVTDVSVAVPFTPEQLDSAAIRVPDLAPDSAWPDAEIALRETAGADCVQAIGSEHLQNFTLHANYDNRNWTWLLLPMYVTWYTDNAGVRRPILINGQTAKIGGQRMASMSKALMWSAVLLGIATVIAGGICVILLFGLLIPVIFVIMPALVIPAGIALAALWPVIRAWQWNRAQ